MRKIPEDLDARTRNMSHAEEFLFRKKSDANRATHRIVRPLESMPDLRNDTNPQGALGRKDDAGKLDVTLFFDDLPHAIEAVTEVLQWAVTKKLPTPYERGSWQGVDRLQQRYRAAQLRHELDRAKAAKMHPTIKEHFMRDKETNLLQLAHIATDALFRLEMACREIESSAYDDEAIHG